MLQHRSHRFQGVVSRREMRIVEVARPSHSSHHSEEYFEHMRRMKRRLDRESRLRQWNWFDDVLSWFGLTRSRWQHRSRPCSRCAFVGK
jgi:hypothetical protein